MIGEKKKALLHDPGRTLDLTLNLAGYSGLDRLPEYQNVTATHTKFVGATATLAYSNLQKSLGAIEDERGVQWNVNGQVNATFPSSFLKSGGNTRGDFSSRSETRRSGFVLQQAALLVNASDPFANFYFGAFGNNWVDKGNISRYREYYSFPGATIDQIGANSFAKGQVEWDLTPLHFRDLGSTKLYSNWARLALFAGGLAANPASSDHSGYADAGAQLDLRLVLFSQVKSTFSAGFAAAHDRSDHTRTETMFSLRIY